MRTKILSSVRAGVVVVALFAAPGAGQVTTRVSVTSAEVQGNHDSFSASTSANGRYVAFDSRANNLVSGDVNGAYDVFVRDRHSGTTELVSILSGGGQANGDSFLGSISADGRHVAFCSYATNLVAGDTNGFADVFVHDRQTGTTERASVDSSGAQADSVSNYPSISADGRYVAFSSFASNLVAGDSDGFGDVFVRDRQSGTTERVSVDSGGAQGNSDSYSPSLSADGRYVAFSSFATNLVAGDTNGFGDAFVHDRQSGTTERVNVDSGGAQANAVSYESSISDDGRHVVFDSDANNLVVGDTNFCRDVFVRDRQSGTTERVSLDSSGTAGNGVSLYACISADGRYVAFDSDANNLVAGDTNGQRDVFVRDRQTGSTERTSVGAGGAQGNSASLSSSISADGRHVSFHAIASNLVGGDTNGRIDVFVRDRDATGFTSRCSAGTDGVIACPCSNPPAGAGRGCDNSSGTGGAILSASGIAYLSQDSVVFTTSGEKPTALSIVAQWTGVNPSGVIFGQGVRCTSGVLKRLYTKTASGGSITAPNFGAGDPAVSARSAALGDTILPGQSRWYLVYYRDATVLGGCPAISTFNATQTGEVAWLP